ncbi:unnamed protein product [Trypanosoma congolense IL3000]|uniref:WGS project CAEQ00000000 data, annotated contig 2392 n=1 Tax=Trypanosoma congolense (strain IL3000) TaxID=1068625 RepID=F9WDR4_TRYCI|nr:unnamed protein product [Trypanosoma congolense IL3000]
MPDAVLAAVRGVRRPHSGASYLDHRSQVGSAASLRGGRRWGNEFVQERIPSPAPRPPSTGKRELANSSCTVSVTRKPLNGRRHSQVGRRLKEHSKNSSIGSDALNSSAIVGTVVNLFKRLGGELSRGAKLLKKDVESVPLRVGVVKEQTPVSRHLSEGRTKQQWRVQRRGRRPRRASPGGGRGPVDKVGGVENCSPMLQHPHPPEKGRCNHPSLCYSEWEKALVLDCPSQSIRTEVGREEGGINCSPCAPEGSLLKLTKRRRGISRSSDNINNVCLSHCYAATQRTTGRLNNGETRRLNASNSEDGYQLQRSCSIGLVLNSTQERRMHTAPFFKRQYSASPGYEENSPNTHDVTINQRVRRIYENILESFVSNLIGKEVDNHFALMHSAKQRALDSYLLRMVLSTLTNVGSVECPQLTHFRGIRRHIINGKAASIREITEDEDDDAVYNAIIGTHSWETFRRVQHEQADKVAVSLKCGISLTYEQLATLGPGMWLSDQIVNAYLGLICDEHNANLEAESTVSLGTHFFAKVQQELRIGEGDGVRSMANLPTLDEKSGALRWLRRRRYILQPGVTRIVLVPVNLSQSHWTLAVLDWGEGKWMYYDSLLTDNGSVNRGEQILRVLAHVFTEARRILCTCEDGTGKCRPTQEGKGLSFVVAKPVIPCDSEDLTAGGFSVVPQQQNAYDCGIFVCHAAWCVVNGFALTFTQEDVTALRRVMLHELLLQRLLKRLPVALYGTE